jgi:hypothetical protein
MTWKQTYVEYLQSKSPGNVKGDFTLNGSIYVIANTAGHVAHYIAQAQNILSPSRKDIRVDRDPMKRRDELNAHLFSAITGVQNLFDAVASACNLKEPRVTGDVSFFPGTDREYQFLTKEFRQIQTYKDALLSLQRWDGMGNPLTLKDLYRKKSCLSLAYL